jgi:hypothetical protein
MHAPLTPSSDLARTVPADAAARQDAITAAVVSLRGEQRRLERLGLELPLARCHQQLRYWEFLGALFALSESDTSSRGRA